MRIARFALVPFLALGLIPLQGCEDTAVPSGPTFSPTESLNPLFTDQDVIFDAGLLGAWQIDDGPVLTFEPADGKAYAIKTDDETVYEARLVRLQGHLFLDVVPTRWPSTPANHELHLDWAQVGVAFGPQLVRVQDSIYLEVVPGALDNTGASLKLRLRPAHCVYRISSEGSTMRLVSLNKEWLTKAIGQGSVSIDHVTVEEGPLLTAKTADLQHLVLEHYEDAEAFAGELNFLRKIPPQPTN